jgi:hypothetical protein
MFSIVHLLLRIMKGHLEKIKYELHQYLIHPSGVSPVTVRAFPMPLAAQSAYTAGVLFRIRRSRSDDGDFAAEEGVAPDSGFATPPEADMTNPDIRIASQNADPIPFRELKGQASAYDARAERLVLGIRAEVEELRDAVAARQQVEEAVLRVDADALLHEPGLVGAVPPMLIARLVDDMRTRIGELEDALDSRSSDLEQLESEHAALERDYAGAQSRLDTLQEVIAALHANIQDLRAARDYERQVGVGLAGAPAALPPGEA